MDFLQFDQPSELKLVGGCLDLITVDTLHLGSHTKSLTFKNMPSVQMDQVYRTLPQVSRLEIYTVDEFKKENFLDVH